MSAQQERVSFPMRVLFTLFALDVCVVALLIRHRALPATPSPESRCFEMGLAAAALVIFAALVWMWWRPMRRLRRASATAGGIAMLLALTAGAAPAGAGVRESMEAYERGNYAGALAACKEAAEQGDASCQNILGILYGSGRGVRASDTEAAKWFRRAAEQGHGYAALNLGYHYEHGLGVPKSDKEAERWYLLAAKQRISAAEYSLGALYLRTTNDAREALKWFRQAARQGYPAAEVAVGLAYETGNGVKRNPRQAAKWYLLGAQAGSGFGQLLIARLYERGSGMEKDPAEAYFWYLLASRSTALPQKERNEARAGVARLKAALSRDQIASVEDEAANFRPAETTHSAAGGKTRGGGSAGGPRLYATGSGFYVTTSGLAVTNNHVVARCGAVRVTEGDQSTPATVVATDPDLDLALVKLPHSVAAAAVFRESPPRLGESVVAMGFPLSGLLTSDAVVTTGIVSALAGTHDNRRELQISAPVQPGNSGGPLLDSNGHIVGVVVASLNAVSVAEVTGAIPENVNFAIKGDEAKAFLRAHGVTPATAANNRELPTAEIAELALKFTVRMECWK
ncbi:MAG TPA: tetratricopeptide repeat-containing serine protease family protein [Stellaceae bacterium]|nr:tetratricopeptide repeat-containing serine protease family protein [Stellaceae bacterium]